MSAQMTAVERSAVERAAGSGGRSDPVDPMLGAYIDLDRPLRPGQVHAMAAAVAALERASEAVEAAFTGLAAHDVPIKLGALSRCLAVLGAANRGGYIYALQVIDAASKSAARRLG